MTRLSSYLFSRFTFEAMALFGVAATLLFLTYSAGQFDLVTVRGQSLWTLLALAALAMPATSAVILYACLGVGLGRAFRGLQNSNELHIIHASGLLRATLDAVALYTVAGSLVLLLITHVIDPWARQLSTDWQSSITADLVSRSLVPHKFIDLARGVSVVISGRDAAGNITGFFADDRRDEAAETTYFAETAIITQDPKGFVLRMTGGAIQYLGADKRLSQVTFSRYDLAIDQLVATVGDADPLPRTQSLALIAKSLSTGVWDPQVVNILAKRSGEALRIIALAIFVTAIAAFPVGDRRRFLELPIELVILFVAFIERGITNFLPGGSGVDIGIGTLLLLVVGIVLLLVRLRVFRPVRRGAAA